MPVDAARVQAVKDAVAPKWRQCRDVVDEIVRLAKEPWIDLRLGSDCITSVRSGGLVLLIGATGRGKTSLAVSLLVEHAQGAGPALAASLELPAEEWTARAVGGRCDASWPDVLRGEVRAERMREVLPERLAIVDRDHASIDAIEGSIDDLRATYPGEPILIAVDYVQLVGADSEEEIRPRIGRVMRDLDKLARDRRVALIALSQGSRSSSRALSSGEKLGAETTDSGAESADLERWASVTLAIGAPGSEAEDGSCAVDLSLGKCRMGGGDRVIPARYNGRTGLWRITGDSRSAAEVRAERQTERQASRVQTLAHAIHDVLVKATEPQSRRGLRELVGGRSEDVRAAVAALLADPGSDVVECGRRERGAYRVWLRASAEAAGIAIQGAS